MKNLISVCVTTFNRKESLKETVQSILNQSYSDFEIIIVDDCSTDGTEMMVRNELLPIDKRIRYIRHETNKGLATARNTAIFNAEGKYFTFLDDDDKWTDDFLYTFVKIAKNYDDTYIFCASTISDNQIQPIKTIEGKLRDFIIEGFTPPVGSQFYFTETLRRIGGYDENVKSGVDHDLWLTLGLHDINIVWLNKDFILVNTAPSDTRMTFNLKKRLNGIDNSLKIWRQRINDKYGSDFFQCLEKNYQYNTYKKFIMHKIKETHPKDLLSYWRKLPKDLFIKDFIRYIQNKMGKKRVLRKPVFIKCTDHETDFLNKILIRNDTL